MKILSDEIRQFYRDKHIPVHLVLNACAKKGLAPIQAYSAMEHCYYKMRDGKEIADHEITRYIINVCKTVVIEDSQWYKSLMAATESLVHDNIVDLERRLLIAYAAIVYLFIICGSLI